MKLMIQLLAVAAFALPLNMTFAADHDGHGKKGELSGPGGDCCDQKDCCTDCEHKDGKHSCCDGKDKAKAKDCCKKCDDEKCKKACKSGKCKKGHCETKSKKTDA